MTDKHAHVCELKEGVKYSPLWTKVYHWSKTIILINTFVQTLFQDTLNLFREIRHPWQIDPRRQYKLCWLGRCKKQHSLTGTAEDPTKKVVQSWGLQSSRSNDYWHKHQWYN